MTTAPRGSNVIWLQSQNDNLEDPYQKGMFDGLILWREFQAALKWSPHRSFRPQRRRLTAAKNKLCEVLRAANDGNPSKLEYKFMVAYHDAMKGMALHEVERHRRAKYAYRKEMA